MMVSLGKYKGLADLRRWVSNANHYIGEEKRSRDPTIGNRSNPGKSFGIRYRLACAASRVPSTPSPRLAGVRSKTQPFFG
jgi:hypothetical protein